MSKLMHPLRYGVVVAVTSGVSFLSLMAMAQAGSTGNRPAVYKRHSHGAPYFGYLSGPAEAWANGRCDLPLRSEFPPCIYPTFQAGSPY